MEQSVGRNSIVGTTVKKPECLPKHVVADEKHSWILGNKVYVATTSGSGCILGASIAEDAGEKELTKAYGTFKKEAQCIRPKRSTSMVGRPPRKPGKLSFPVSF
jgi:hypothetical protein